MKYYLLLIALVFSIGCTMPNIFGSDVLKIQVSTQAEGPKDAVIIKDIETIPRSPILPDQQVLLFFTIENRDDTKEAKNVKVDLFNPSSFKDVRCNKCSFDRILPGEQKQVEIRLKAPSEKDIAGVKLETDLHFRVTYDFESSTIMEALVVNEDEIRARQRQGQSISLERNNILGSGTVRVEGEMKGTPYILANQLDKDQIVGIFLIKVVNVGDKTKGDLVGGEIPSGQLSIEFPSGIGSVECTQMGEVESASVTCNEYVGRECKGGCGGEYFDVYKCSDGSLDPRRVEEADSACCDECKNPDECLAAGCSWFMGGTPNAYCGPHSGLSGRDDSIDKISRISLSASGVASLQGSGTTCTNDGAIKLFKGESNPFRFNVKNSPDITEPFRTHNIKTSISYTYELRGSVHAVVNPLQNV